MPNDLVTLYQSPAAKRALIETYANEFLRYQRDSYKSFTYGNFMFILAFMLKDRYVLYLSVFLRKLFDGIFPERYDSFRRSFDVNLVFAIIIFSIFSVIVPNVTDKFLYKNKFYHDRDDYPKIVAALRVSRCTNSSSEELDKHFREMERFVQVSQGLAVIFNKHKLQIYVLGFISILFNLWAAYLERNVLSLAREMIIFASTIPALASMWSFKKFKKETAKLERDFFNYLQSMVAGIPGIKCYQREPAGVYSIFTEISYQQGTGSTARISINDDAICVRFKDIMKALLCCLSREPGINLIKYDLEGVNIKLTSPCDYLSTPRAREYFLDLLKQKSNNLFMKNKLTPELNILTAPLSLKWNAIELENEDHSSVLNLTVIVADLDLSIRDKLVTILHEIFQPTRVRVEHDEIIVVPVLKDIHAGFQAQYHNREFDQKKNVSATSELSVSPRVTEAAVISSIAVPSAHVKRKHLRVVVDNVSTPTALVDLHIKWMPDLPEYDAKSCETGLVFPMKSAYTKANRFFFFVNRELSCPAETLEKMKRGQIIGEKGQGFKRCGVMYKTCEGTWAQAFFKFKEPRQDGRVYLRVSDAKTHPQHMLLIADGYDPHPHKK